MSILRPVNWSFLILSHRRVCAIFYIKIILSTWLYNNKKKGNKKIKPQEKKKM